MNQISKNIIASNGLKRKVISENKTADIIFETNRDGQIDRYVVHKFNGDVESWDILKGLNTRNEIDVYSGARELYVNAIKIRQEHYNRLLRNHVISVIIAAVLALTLLAALVYAYQS